MLQVKKFSDIPISTREEGRGSRPHPAEPRFRLVAREEGSFPFVVGKEFQAFPSYLKRRRFQQERREELQGLASIPRVPQMSKSIQEEPVFPALPRRSRRGSTHTTVARGTALLESLVGKPPWKATDPFIHTSASETLLLQFLRKWQVHAPNEMRNDSPGETTEVRKDSCQHWRGILRVWPRLQKGLRPRHRRERNPERLQSNSLGDWPFRRPPERSLRSRLKLRAPATTRENPGGSPLQAR